MAGEIRLFPAHEISVSDFTIPDQGDCLIDTPKQPRRQGLEPRLDR